MHLGRPRWSSPRAASSLPSAPSDTFDTVRRPGRQLLDGAARRRRARPTYSIRGRPRP
ncbi:MAG: hypothetical protein M0C28_02140 [Candidatus Moduliflexus flocculans]|nr:hypothetical protein [Candidatus Moduliflexus flocculans]